MNNRQGTPKTTTMARQAGVCGLGSAAFPSFGLPSLATLLLDNFKLHSEKKANWGFGEFPTYRISGFSASAPATGGANAPKSCEAPIDWRFCSPWLSLIIGVYLCIVLRLCEVVGRQGLLRSMSFAWLKRLCWGLWWLWQLWWLVAWWRNPIMYLPLFLPLLDCLFVCRWVNVNLTAVAGTESSRVHAYMETAKEYVRTKSVRRTQWLCRPSHSRLDTTLHHISEGCLRRTTDFVNKVDGHASRDAVGSSGFFFAEETARSTKRAMEQNDEEEKKGPNFEYKKPVVKIMRHLTNNYFTSILLVQP